MSEIRNVVTAEIPQPSVPEADSLSASAISVLDRYAAAWAFVIVRAGNILLGGVMIAFTWVLFVANITASPAIGMIAMGSAVLACYYVLSDLFDGNMIGVYLGTLLLVALAPTGLVLGMMQLPFDLLAANLAAIAVILIVLALVFGLVAELLTGLLKAIFDAVDDRLRSLFRLPSLAQEREADALGVIMRAIFAANGLIDKGPLSGGRRIDRATGEVQFTLLSRSIAAEQGQEDLQGLLQRKVTVTRNKRGRAVVTISPAPVMIYLSEDGQ